jgi:(E)-4-hydroxy-3-methylbut-2-enyl-diphosphate synthase
MTQGQLQKALQPQPTRHCSPPLRRRTRPVRVGSVTIGGEAPISVQSMWKEPLRSAELPAAVQRITCLQAVGCELLRFSVPDLEAAELLGALASRVQLPVVADIHFDYRLALRCLDFPVAKIRINPGNIGQSWKVAELVRKAADRGVPMRIGVNSGSLPRSLAGEKDVAAAMVKAAEEELSILSRFGYGQVVFSLKSPQVETTVEANRLFSASHDYPLHLGVTEAGPLVQGIVKNTLALSRLLAEGVGDTVRVSLSDTPENEVAAAWAILQGLEIRREGAEIVSCPTCGRTEFDVRGFLAKADGLLKALRKSVTIAVMGCPVNGPGEARRADLGITGSGRQVLFFKNGRIIRRVTADDAIETLREELERL